MAVDLPKLLRLHQEKLLTDLALSREAFENAEAKGDATESHWRELIEGFLPKRYQATPAFVLDCDGNKSDFIDIVIHDRQYCPLLFEEGNQKYIPAESVYAAFEIKQNLSKNHIEYAAAKGESVRALRRTSLDIVHAGGKHGPRPLFEILTGILVLDSEWKPPLGEPFAQAIHATAGERSRINLGCCLRHGAFNVNWDEQPAQPPQITASEPDVSLMFFLMALFTQLQRLGTVPAIDLNAYGRSLASPLESLSRGSDQGSRPIIARADARPVSGGV